ncbi:sugar ABC transporter substrate-binding protein [Bacillus coahuilensis m2-6]|uniref:Sugar ABC transporter substrate-binding protein n=1 Tax=Bacillus coahuilensis p1.1.43 TaxID=1150625 RepID=A0A147K3V3_9BACI|nr:substrate-binding domain-containing protein [Bacillus coahuilensis]KUP03924.1 sugar ABC transporter substrate-binding protein [Bacillus coahuilensis p1.1.43]KUP04853.1 sugar ABC transporter substrate-binding protein [Bacillus coahuilensis m2-6]
MPKVIITLLSIVCGILFYFTLTSAVHVFQTDWQLPQKKKKDDDQIRLVLITQELETPFWDKVAYGASTKAMEEGAILEVWGSYGSNEEEFLKNMEIAIYSQVDGVIVQGLETEEFAELIKTKASSYGIPVITIANDIPLEDSLRRTYVGSNQYYAGQLMAKELVSDMGGLGEVVLMTSSDRHYYQEQRLNGMKDVLKVYPDIQLIEFETVIKREEIRQTTKEVLNQYPGIQGWLAVDANLTGDMVREIESRSKIEPYFIYSFDDTPESLTLLKQGKLDGILEQSPQDMGEISVGLMMELLRNETAPLNWEGYLTDIQMVKVPDEK